MFTDILIGNVVKLRDSSAPCRKKEKRKRKRKREGGGRGRRNESKEIVGITTCTPTSTRLSVGREKRCGRARKREAKRARALYIPWISAIVFFVKDRKCLVYPHRCALTFNRTLIDCGIYFFSYLQSPPPLSALSCSSLFVLSPSLSHSDSPSLLHPQCRSLYPKSPGQADRSLIPILFPFPDGCTDR